MQCKLSLYTWTSVSQPQSHIPNQIIWKTIQPLNIYTTWHCLHVHKMEVCKDNCAICYSVSIMLHLLCVQQKVNALTSLCLLKRIKCDKWDLSPCTYWQNASLTRVTTTGTSLLHLTHFSSPGSLKVKTRLQLSQYQHH